MNLAEYNQKWQDYVEAAEAVLSKYNGQPHSRSKMASLHMELDNLWIELKQCGYVFPYIWCYHTWHEEVTPAIELRVRTRFFPEG